MQIFKKNSVTYLPYLVNVTVDICKFLGGESVGAAGFYTRFMIGWVNKYSNINHSCPYLVRNQVFTISFQGILTFFFYFLSI